MVKWSMTALGRWLLAWLNMFGCEEYIKFGQVELNQDEFQEYGLEEYIVSMNIK